MNQLNKSTRRAIYDIICSYLDEPIKHSVLNPRRVVGKLCLRVHVLPYLLGCVYIQVQHGDKVLQRYRLNPGNWKSSGVMLTVFDQLCFGVGESLRTASEELRQRYIDEQDYTLRLTGTQMANFRIRGTKEERSTRMIIQYAMYPLL